MNEAAPPMTSFPPKSSHSDTPVLDSSAGFRVGAFLSATVLAVACFTLLSGTAFCQTRLFEEDPYDQITLDDANDNVVLKLQPLDLPNRQLPEDPSPNDVLVVRLLDNPDPPYEVKWHSIEKAELFEDLILKEAERLVAQRELDEAFEYFQFMEANHPRTKGLAAAIDNYLFEEAKLLHVQKQYAAALAVLLDLRKRNANWPSLENAIGLTTDALVAQYDRAEEFFSARTLLENLAGIYPRHTIVQKWQTAYEARARTLMAETRQAIDDGDLAKARSLGYRAASIWPRLPGIKEVLESIHNQHSRVVVAVSEPAVVTDAGELDNWVSRRQKRLLYRTLMEFTGPGVEGGNYVCPLGEMEIRELGLQLSFTLKPNLRWSTGDSEFTGYDLSQRLLTIADPGHRLYRVEWAELLGGVSVDGIYGVVADLRRPYIRPAALLQTTVAPYRPSGTGEGASFFNGPYVAKTQSEAETVYMANPQYFAQGPTQPKEIVEKYFEKGAEAIWELQRHRVEIIDRVNPWDLDKVRAMKQLVVQPYGMPLVHCLAVNLDNPLLARRGFRRALVYGIHREAILNRLLGGAQEEGCQVLSGPFSPGISHDDPLGYAYDPWIEPRTYEPRLAVALAKIAFQELVDAQAKKGIQLTAMPQLTLGHPPHEIARLACGEIQRQLGLVDIPIVLRELTPGASSRAEGDLDLVYAELAVWEPVVDSRRLLGENGISGGASSYMSLALRQLEHAADWAQAGEKLRQIHRLAHQELSVVPLWQLTDHFVYHNSLKGVGTGPVSIYQNVESWQPAFHFPADVK